MNSESKGGENWCTSLRKQAKDGVLQMDRMSLGSSEVLAMVAGAAPSVIVQCGGPTTQTLIKEVDDCFETQLMV